MGLTHFAALRELAVASPFDYAAHARLHVVRVASLSAEATDHLSDDEAREQGAIASDVAALGTRREAEASQHRQALNGVEQSLAALPAPYDLALLDQARQALFECQLAYRRTEADHLDAVRAEQANRGAAEHIDTLRSHLARLASHQSQVERALGDWSLFAHALRDGRIRLGQHRRLVPTGGKWLTNVDILYIESM